MGAGEGEEEVLLKQNLRNITAAWILINFKQAQQARPVLRKQTAFVASTVNYFMAATCRRRASNRKHHKQSQ